MSSAKSALISGGWSYTAKKMARLVKKHATERDLLSVPDNVIGEIFDGDLYVSPRPQPRHAFATGRMFGDLFGLNGPPGGQGRPGGWCILFEPELHLGEDILVPDVAAWRYDRMRILPAKFITSAPDWVCEVLSPSTRGIDRSRKMPIYARARVEHLWFVDPGVRLIEIYRLAGDNWRLVSALGEELADRLRIPPFDEIELSPATWWPTVEGDDKLDPDDDR